jgi:hypothetical protein
LDPAVSKIKLFIPIFKAVIIERLKLFWEWDTIEKLTFGLLAALLLSFILGIRYLQEMINISKCALLLKC